MYVFGGEPPFIENPEPRFGSVISKLNEVTYKLQDCTYSFNEGTKDKLILFSQNIAQFINDVVLPIDTHLALKGAVHGETQFTVGLGKKDNYRTATLTEQTNLTPVLAYVTPHGVKLALDKNITDFDPSVYQSNDVFQIATFYYPNQFSITPPTVVEPTRYFMKDTRPTTLISSDRIVISPRSDTNSYQRQDIFISNPVAIQRRTQLTEIQNLTSGYIGSNWNAIGSETTQGKVALFKPLVDKQIYDMRNGLNMDGTNKNFILFNGYGSSLYKGFATAVSVTGTVATIQHRFFKTDFFDTDPILVDLVDSTYKAAFTQIGKTTYVDNANGSHSYDINDFLTLSPGQTLTYDNTGTGITTGLVWSTQDFELYLMVNIPVKVNDVSMVITFVESIIPGNFVAGNLAQFRQLGILVKDTIGPDLQPVQPANWVKVCDLWDFNNTVQFPGVVLPTGEIVKSGATKYTVRVKRVDSGAANFKSWMTGARSVVPIKQAKSETYTPSRYTPFGTLPERIIPVKQADGVTTYLVYGLDEITGNYMWNELSWTTNPKVVVLSGGSKNAFSMPDFNTRIISLAGMPSSLSVMTGVTNGGVAVSAFCFTKENNWTGSSSFTYADQKVALGTPVTLAPNSLNSLLSAGNAVMSRAAILNPFIPKESREANIQVMDRFDNKVFVTISDGVSYAECAALSYTVTGGIVSLIIPPTGLGLVPVTAGTYSPTGSSRMSASGDNPRQPYSDLLISAEIPTRNWDIVVPRAFGGVYGDLSFSLDLPQSAMGVLTPWYVNQARLYKGTQQFDLVDELLAPVLVPFYGVLQYLPTNPDLSSAMVRPTAGDIIDMFDINEPGWVRIPAGSRVMIRGRAYILDREYPIKVDPNGVSYCYLARIGEVLVGISSPVARETANNEVLFGIATNGILNMTSSYLVIDNHVITPNRRGGAIPMFADDGDLGTNQFFTKRDLIN